MNIEDDGIAIDINAELWGFDAADVAPRVTNLSFPPPNMRVLRLNWPVAVLCSSVVGAVTVLSYKAGQQNMRDWVDDWTGGPD